MRFREGGTVSKVKVTQKENEPEVLVEVTAQAIVEIAAAIKKMRNGRLKEKSLVMLIKRASASWVSETMVRGVLNGIAYLEREHLK